MENRKNIFSTIIILFALLVCFNTIQAQSSQSEIKKLAEKHMAMLNVYLHKTITIEEYIKYMGSNPSNLAMFEDIKKTMQQDKTYDANFVNETIAAIKTKLIVVEPEKGKH